MQNIQMYKGGTSRSPHIPECQICNMSEQFSNPGRGNFFTAGYYLVTLLQTEIYFAFNNFR